MLNSERGGKTENAKRPEQEAEEMECDDDGSTETRIERPSSNGRIQKREKKKRCGYEMVVAF